VLRIEAVEPRPLTLKPSMHLHVQHRRLRMQ
jgi:hypothetical protein